MESRQPALKAEKFMILLLLLLPAVVFVINNHILYLLYNPIDLQNEQNIQQQNGFLMEFNFLAYKKTSLNFLCAEHISKMRVPKRITIYLYRNI